MRILNKKILFLLGVVMIALGVVAYQFEFSTQNSVESLQHATILENPREINAFELEGWDHKPFTKASIAGKWTLLFFGFTSCPSLCPTTMAALGKMYKLLESKHVAPLPQVVMVTLDPSRDKSENLQAYVRGFNPNFISARSTDEATVNAMARELGIASMKIESEKAKQDYSFEHTGTVMLLNPQGQLSAYFTTPHSAAEMAHDYEMIVK